MSQKKLNYSSIDPIEDAIFKSVATLNMVLNNVDENKEELEASIDSIMKSSMAIDYLEETHLDDLKSALVQIEDFCKDPHTEFVSELGIVDKMSFHGVKLYLSNCKKKFSTWLENLDKSNKILLNISHEMAYAIKVIEDFEKDMNTSVNFNFDFIQARKFIVKALSEPVSNETKITLIQNFVLEVDRAKASAIELQINSDLIEYMDSVDTLLADLQFLSITDNLELG